MKSSLAIIALVLAAAVSGQAIAQQGVPQTPEECVAAGGVWDQAAGMCRPAQPPQ
jgi:tripartite-type tricarboxylate transporter receptor subunit TctC